MLCFLAYKALTKQRRATTSIIQPQKTVIPHNSQNMVTGNSLYDVIDERDMLDNECVHQLEKSSVDLEVFQDSNIRDSGEMKSFENHGNPCQLLPTAQTNSQENNVKVDGRSLINDDSTSSFNEIHQKTSHDDLSLYQPMIKSEMSPPEVTEYLTLAPDNNGMNSGMTNYQIDAVSQKKNRMQHFQDVEKKAMINTYGNVIGCSVHKTLSDI